MKTMLVYEIYAVIVILGGIMGYVKAKSTPSLAAGFISGILVALAGFLLHHHPRLGEGLAALVSLVLTIVFAQRYAKTKNPMPAVPMAVLSVLVLLFSAFKILHKYM